ncbi:hypothetical protein HAX54_041328 [Datura stramonium]|uniref:Uncharacterized protein n=1 Tax=Datura stramonium TaxID=4076 RepID=A0ABS8VQF0_DATST|nr:hypothetical protein [Datura stramonium]
MGFIPTITAMIYTECIRAAKAIGKVECIQNLTLLHEVYEDCSLWCRDRELRKSISRAGDCGPTSVSRGGERRSENWWHGFFVLECRRQVLFVRKNEDDFDGDEVMDIFDDEIEDVN